MKQFTVYESPTGAILRGGTCQDETFEAQAMNAGESVFEGAVDWATQYFVGGAPVSRPPSSVALSQVAAVVTLTGVNAGIAPSIVNQQGDAVGVATSDGGAISATLPSGAYLVSVDQFPELPFSQQITVA